MGTDYQKNSFLYSPKATHMAEYLIKKSAIINLGYNFIQPEYLPAGEDEYYLRNRQNTSGIAYRKLTAYEIEALVRNRNTSDDWNMILVSDAFNPTLVRDCNFFGLVRIGKLEPYALEYSDMRFVVGLYNSTIISCDFGDNVVIENVNYLSHFIIGNEVILTNVNELATTDYAKFGNGIIKEGENESIRIMLELCNENGGRSVIPFSGMLPGDAFLWSKYRDDELLLQKFTEFTESTFHKNRGYYGMIGDRTVIKNCLSIKDVLIGTDAYIKGANKLKNLTVHSDAESKTQIGEGCELVNGIIHKGCRIFYGVKAVRFIMASHSQLKYGARLINSYLGNNSTISCCEVLNSLIFPAHEQHHNNSFLCASLVLGQSNIPAGATIGSNHNSRAADGEIVAARGFWPGLCVSLKHNSKFASFTMIAKGDYMYELNIPIPFSLVSMDTANDRLLIMPAYWFMYNMYALERNSWKYADRDKRTEQIQLLEYDYLAPDTVNEMLSSLVMFETLVGTAYLRRQNNNNGREYTDTECTEKGRQLLRQHDEVINELKVIGDGFENSKRETIILKVQQAYDIFREMILYYSITQLMYFIEENNISTMNELFRLLPQKTELNEWINTGGQLIPKKEIEDLKQKIHNNLIRSWDEVHAFYEEQGKKYSMQKLQHSLASLKNLLNLELKEITASQLSSLLDRALELKKKMTKSIYESREKDYTNTFRTMVYDTPEEMEKVVGGMNSNSFMKHKEEELKDYTERIMIVKERFKAVLV